MRQLYDLPVSLEVGVKSTCLVTLNLDLIKLLLYHHFLVFGLDLH